MTTPKDIPVARDLPDIIRQMRRPRTKTDTGLVYVGTWIGPDDPGNDPGTDEMSPPFLNGWTNIAGAASGFRFNAIGNIEISALVKDGTIGMPAWIMPVDYRRPYDVRSIQAVNAARTVCKIWVKSTGEVIIEEIIVVP